MYLYFPAERERGGRELSRMCVCVCVCVCVFSAPGSHLRINIFFICYSTTYSELADLQIISLKASAGTWCPRGYPIVYSIKDSGI